MDKIFANGAPLEASSPVPFSVNFHKGKNTAYPLPQPKEEDNAKTTHSDQAQPEKTMTTDRTSTNPAFNIQRGNKLRPSYSSAGNKKKMKNGIQSCDIVIAESIRWLGEAVIRTEEARMKTMRGLERMRAETEIRRGKTELKRTQIIADTQLEIARLMSSKCAPGQGCATATPPFQPGPS